MPEHHVRPIRATRHDIGDFALLALMVAYGGFLFTFALHLQGVLGESPLRAGLTFLPAAATTNRWVRASGW